MKYFRLATYYGASIGWQLIYSPLGLSEKTKGKYCLYCIIISFFYHIIYALSLNTGITQSLETILFNFVSKLDLPEPISDEEDDPYPFKPPERSRIEQILDRKNEKRNDKTTKRIQKR